MWPESPCTKGSKMGGDFDQFMHETGAMLKPFSLGILNKAPIVQLTRASTPIPVTRERNIKQERT